MRRTVNILLALATAALLVWPALINGYPLIYPDTLDYVATGRTAITALTHLHHADFHAVRSAMYAIGIFFFHWNRTLWPILALNAACVVWPVYLLTRSFAPRDAFRRTLYILAALSIFTGMSWYISLVMPDIFGAPVYLSLYLLAFARNTLRRAEQIGLAILAIFGATAHSTHLLLTILLCAMLWLAWLIAACRRKPFALAPDLRSLVVVTSVLAGAIFVLLASNARLSGRASLDGDRPPYLIARILSDGPGKDYLRDHCAAGSDWVLCRHLDNLPEDEDGFLWGDKGIWDSATPAEQAAIKREEMPLVLGTLRHYPRQQLAASFRNFRDQLIEFPLYDFENNEYMQAHLNTAIPNGRLAYDRSRQARNGMPEDLFTTMQMIAVIVSIAVLALSLSGILRKPVEWRRRWLALRTLIFFVVIANAAVSGVLSAVDSRYQARVIWLLPLLSALMLSSRFSSSSVKADASPQCFPGESSLQKNSSP